MSSKHPWKLSCRCFYLNFPLMSDKSTTERSLLVRSKIFPPCFNRLTGDHLYSCLNTEIFRELVRTQLCQKSKVFSGIFIAFFKSPWNFEHFEKKDGLHSLNISELIDTEECGFSNARKLLLQNTLLKSTS